MRHLLLLSCLLLFLTGCYSFRGIALPEGAEEVVIDLFVDNSLNSPPTLALDVTEALRVKVRDEARMRIVEQNPDIEFKGTLVDFRVSAEAPTAGDRNTGEAFANLNRLTIVVAVEYINHLDENDKGWRSNFSSFFDFPGNQTLESVQAEAIEDVLDQITELIFNKAFTENW